MLVLGLLLLGGTVAFAIVLAADNLGGGPHYSVTLFDHHLVTVSTLDAFLAGAALALLLCLGMALTTAGTRREYRRSRELRAGRRQLKEAARGFGDDAATATAATTTATRATATDPESSGDVVLTKRPRRGLGSFSH